MNKGNVLSSIIGAAVGAVAGAGLIGKVILKKSGKEAKLAQKHLALYLMMNQWVKVKQENKSIVDYLEKSGYKEIAIYGMNYVGETLLNELSGSNITVRYGIDKNADYIYSDVEVYTLDDDLSKVDAVVVTPITFYDEIEEQLSEKMDCPILSMEDILYEI